MRDFLWHAQQIATIKMMDHLQTDLYVVFYRYTYELSTTKCFYIASTINIFVFCTISKCLLCLNYLLVFSNFHLPFLTIDNLSSNLWIGLLGKIYTGNHRYFPMKIMGLKPVIFHGEIYETMGKSMGKSMKPGKFVPTKPESIDHPGWRKMGRQPTTTLFSIGFLRLDVSCPNWRATLPRSDPAGFNMFQPCRTDAENKGRC